MNSSTDFKTEETVTYVFPDFNAVKYIERGFINENEWYSVEEGYSSGFEVYLIEQWVLARKIGCLVCAYTGNESSRVPVIKFTVAKKDFKDYPGRFQQYLNELMVNHAKAKQMEHGDSRDAQEILFVTNLSALPSILNLVLVHYGDIRVLETDFVVNSNLKRLQCGGRSLALSTKKVSDSSENKFRQMYMISAMDVPIKFAVRELVNIIQTCLFYFDLLDARYCDGLLCNKTEEAIIDWWNLIGLPHYNFKPNYSQGILPSKTIAAIISLILSIKLRIQLLGCDVPKDPFDYENFMIAIGQAQKQMKLEKKRKLDLLTLNKLFTITNAKLQPEKLFVGPDIHDDSNYDSLFNGQSQNAAYQNYGFSSNLYRRNMKNYTKEFKKLTNVVKNTVQDHILSPGKESDELPNASASKSSGVRIRNKIAKLADNVSPLDVETLELDVLVTKYTYGKTLSRLWHVSLRAISPDQLHFTFPQQDAQNHHQQHQQRHGHHHHSRHQSGNNGSGHHKALSNGNDSTSKQYTFISLKDIITNTQAQYAATDAFKLSKGLNRMKLGLQNKRLLLSTNQLRKGKFNSSIDVPENGDSRDVGQVENGLEQKGDFERLAQCKTAKRHALFAICKTNDLGNFNNQLFRRNSFPLAEKGHEVNLGELELVEHKVTPKTYGLRRCSSFSLVESQFTSTYDPSLVTVGKLSSTYLDTCQILVELGKLKEDQSGNKGNIATQRNIKSLYKTLNEELKSLRRVHTQMLSNKERIIDGELPNKLRFNIDELSATIDRLIYETRSVSKRVNELEDDAKVFNRKLKRQSIVKVDAIVENLIYLNRFLWTFDNIEERHKVVQKLVGKDPQELNYDEKVSKQVQDNEIMRCIVLFVYEFVASLLQLFKFDRSNMNIERIRNSWTKLDPNRKFSNKIYSLIGRDPPATNVLAGSSTTD